MARGHPGTGEGPPEGQGWIGHWSPGIGDPSVMGWVTVALYLVAAWLCFLDLQSAFTEVMRVVAREQGWYEARRQYQYAFIGAVAVLAAVVGTALIAAVWRLGRALKLASLGLVFVLAFVTVRAMSFHHVDALIGTRVLNVRVNWIFEIGGIAVVMAGAVLGLRGRPGAQRPSRHR